MIDAQDAQGCGRRFLPHLCRHAPVATPQPVGVSCRARADGPLPVASVGRAHFVGSQLWLRRPPPCPPPWSELPPTPMTVHRGSSCHTIFTGGRGSAGASWGLASVRASSSAWVVASSAVTCSRDTETSRWCQSTAIASRFALRPAAWTGGPSLPPRLTLPARSQPRRDLHRDQRKRHTEVVSKDQCATTLPSGLHPLSGPQCGSCQASRATVHAAVCISRSRLCRRCFSWNSTVRAISTHGQARLITGPGDRSPRWDI